jgi:hypothetical protein
MPSQQKLAEFVAWVKQHLTGDEKGEAQHFLERLFQPFGHAGLNQAGATIEMRVAKSTEAGGGTAFADLVWRPTVLVEMKKHGVDLQKHYRRWSRLGTAKRPQRGGLQGNRTR